MVETVAGDTPDGRADIALFDTFAGRRHALERVRAMAADGDIGKVVLYTWDAPAAFLNDVTVLNVDGVIMKSETGERLVEALERIHRGEATGPDPADGDHPPTVLTEREREVFALIARGAPNREIARELYLSVDTVKTHVRNVFRKLDVPNRTLAALGSRSVRAVRPDIQGTVATSDRAANGFLDHAASRTWRPLTQGSEQVSASPERGSSVTMSTTPPGSDEWRRRLESMLGTPATDGNDVRSPAQRRGDLPGHAGGHRQGRTLRRPGHVRLLAGRHRTAVRFGARACGATRLPGARAARCGRSTRNSETN